MKNSDWQKKREAVLKRLGRPSEPNPPASEDYLQALSAYTDGVFDCIARSKEFAGRKPPTARHYWASALFVSMCNRAVSLAILCPHSAFSYQVIETWDFSSIAGIARSLMETRFAFFYICIDECSDDEWRFRWALLRLHDACARLVVAGGRNPVISELQAFKDAADEIRRELESTATFKALAEKRQRSLLKGETPYLESLESIATRAGVDLAEYKWLNKLYSSHVHSYPLSFFRHGAAGNAAPLPNPAEEGVIRISLLHSLKLIVRARDEYVERMKDVDPI